MHASPVSLSITSGITSSTFPPPQNSRVLAGTLGLCLLALTCGCGRDSETPTANEDSTAADTETAGTPVSKAPAAPVATEPTGLGEMSMDDLGLGEPRPTVPTAEGSPPPQDENPDTPQVAAVPEIPQTVLDAPVKRFVDRYQDETPRKVFEAKVFDNGQVMYHGGFVEYRPDGTKFKAGRYQYSQKDGEWTWWNVEGRVVKQGHYVANNPEGEWRIYRNDGTLKRVEQYHNGLAEGVWTAYREDGKSKLWERGFKAKRPAGMWTEFYADGTKRLEIPYRAGEKHGRVRQWYENGKLAGELEYEHGRRHGVSKEYDIAGNLRNEMQWEDDQRKISRAN